MERRAGAVVPPEASIPDLAEIAALAVQAEPTPLLLDNVALATQRTCASVERLISAADAVALSANTSRTPAERRKLETLYPRCELRQLKPLPRETARRLLWQTLDRVPDIETLRETCDRLVAAQIESATEADRLETRQIAQAMIDKAQRVGVSPN